MAGCDVQVHARKQKTTNLENEIPNNKEMKKMSSSMVQQMMPEFTMDAYDAKTGHYTSVSSNDYQGKWAVVCFYPADFTFVCPTEIAAMNAKYDEFQAKGVEILAISTDTKFSHKRFVETEPLLKGLKLTIGADTTREVSSAFGVLIEEVQELTEAVRGDATNETRRELLDVAVAAVFAVACIDAGAIDD